MMRVLVCKYFDNKYLRTLMIRILLLIIVVFGLFVKVQHISASVTLVYFRAISEDGAVFLEWETATEIDSAGFYVSRSTSQSGNFERIGSFISSKGDSVVGAYYEYRDSTVENGVTYFYVLESWDYDNTVNYSDPVTATPGITDQTTTPTVTSTLAQTPSISPSPTPTTESGVTPTVTNTPNRTSTVGPTRTNTSVPNPTATPNPTFTPTAPVTDTPPPMPTATIEEQTLTPSATLIPLPTIVVVFPAVEWTATPSPSSTPTLTPEPQEDYLKTGFRAIGLVGLVCVIGILWVMIAIWTILLLWRLSA